ncbi:MAG: alpha-L-fucosidase [Spirochaetes bacterium]|nr:alpha-L-fucosidase [Spirochaetota bacterium]
MNALPAKTHRLWADCEIGVIIHLDVQVFEPSYRFREQRGYVPPASVFNPRALDTDQWIETAVKAGAKYAVLVAKHCSGFSLWPTKAHDYSVAACPWRGGKGDIVADFIASCQRFGVRPGLYASASCNAFLNVDNPGRVLSGDAGEQERYNRIVEQQLTELWGNYGPLFEIWFDGGVLPVVQGGPYIVPLLTKLQPDAVVFQGPKECASLLRWVGNERGEAPYPCWSSTTMTTSDDGTKERIDCAGSPDGILWAPAEADMPNRDQHKAFMGGWFWRENDEQFLYSVEHLVERYYQSVGRNTNLLLGMVIDDRGLVPEADVRQCTGFGRAVARDFSRCLGRTSGNGNELTIAFSGQETIDRIVIMEDISSGECIRSYAVDVVTENGVQRLCAGSAVGHKRIERIPPVPVSSITLKILSAEGIQAIRS